MNVETLRIELDYQLERASLLLQDLAAIGQTQALGEYHPVTDAMKRIDQQIERLESGKLDKVSFREAMRFIWNVLNEYEWQLFEFKNRNNPRWQQAKAIQARISGLELRRREPVRRSR